MYDLRVMVRWAIIGVGAAILGYFLLGLVSKGGHKAGNVAGSLQRKF